MKKVIYTFLLIFLCQISTFAQSEMEFAPVGAKWIYKEGGGCNGSLEVKCEKDTIVDNILMKKLTFEPNYECTPNFVYIVSQPTNANYNQEISSVLIYQEEEKVFVYENGFRLLLFDFGAAIGDTIWHIADEQFTTHNILLNSTLNTDSIESVFFTPYSIALSNYSNVNTPFNSIEEFQYFDDLNYLDDETIITYLNTDVIYGIGNFWTSFFGFNKPVAFNGFGDDPKLCYYEDENKKLELGSCESVVSINEIKNKPIDYYIQGNQMQILNIKKDAEFQIYNIKSQLITQGTTENGFIKIPEDYKINLYFLKINSSTLKF